LRSRGWADRVGLGWLALDSLDQNAAEVGEDWPLLVIDGFDRFTPMQLALLERLAAKAERLLITLTGTLNGSDRPLAHSWFNKTRRDLEQRLGVKAQPLPETRHVQAPSLAHLQSQLFTSDVGQSASTDTVELIEAPDRAAEVRAALRWLKARLLQDGLGPGEVALVARDVMSYRHFIRQIADEFRLPIRLADGLPLRSNPAIAALLDLLRLVLPQAEGETEPALPWRQFVEAWRSPYFDWSALPAEGATQSIGIGPADADLLDAAARWGRVVGGLDQWEEILSDLAARPDAESERQAEAADDERGVSPGVPVGAQAQELKDKLERFI